VLLVATVVFLFAQAGLTPFSVFVSGYTRADGTQVSSYSRRPPGSVPHDQPYQLLNVVGLVGIVVGVFFAGRPIWHFFSAPPETLIPMPKGAPASPSPPTPVQSPDRSARARKNWKCLGCSIAIARGELYRYVGRDSRQRYCQQRAIGLVAKHREWRKQQRAYKLVLVEHQAVIERAEECEGTLAEFLKDYRYQGELTAHLDGLGSQPFARRMS
jgi:hypothetical protein